ncbi:MAG: efflux RND transporter periplasmic adaptor subunit [Bryobacteraceae bacterium]
MNRPCLALLMVAATLVGCGKGHQESTNAANPPAAPAGKAPSEPEASKPAGPKVVQLGPNAPELKEMTVEAVRVVPIPVEDASAPALIEANPNRIGRAMLPVPGRIVNVMVQLGDAVSAGQPLATVESPAVADAEAAYVQAVNAVRQAEIAVAKASADLTRLTDLFEHQAVAQKEVLSANTVHTLAKANLDQAQSSRLQAQHKLEFLGLKADKSQQQVIIKAPIAGKVLDVSVVAGEFRSETGTPLITISDLSRVWATSEVPESQIRQYRVGGSTILELVAFPDETFHGRVTRIADTADKETRTIKVNAELDNKGGRLRPQMFGRMRYVQGLAPAMWIPEAAVVRIGDKDHVFVEETRGHFLLREVELGKRHDAGFSVANGLKQGERVVTRGAVYLKGVL